MTFDELSEGRFSRSHLITPGAIYGLDTSEHWNEGYQLVKVPSEIAVALIRAGLLKKIKRLLYDSDFGWIISFEVGAFESRCSDFKELIRGGLSGVRVDKDQTIIYFNKIEVSK